MPEGGTDWSDVLIAFATSKTSKYLYFAIIFAILVWSGWASPENVADIIERGARAWRCQS